MRLKLPVLLVLFFLSAAASAQYNPYWQWGVADTFNTYQNSHPRQVAAAANGKALWGRLISNKLTYGNTIFGDYSLSVLDTAGHTVTSAVLTGKVALLDAHADGAGNWYVLGSFYDSLRLPGSSLITRGGVGNEPDHFIARFNAGSLSVGWLKLIGTTNDATASCFAINAGTIYLPVDSGNITGIQALTTGSGIASLLFTQGGRSATSSIAVEPGGSIMLAGSCGFSGIDFNGVMQQPVNTNPYPAYLVRYSPTGLHRWHYWLPDITCVARMVNVAPGGIIYYTGALYSGFSFGAQALHGPAHTYDFVAARLDTSGNVAWVRQIDTAGGGDASLERPYNAIVAPDTSLIIFAQTRGFIDWRNNVSTAANQYYQSAAVSFGKDGHTRWARQIKGDFTGNDQIATDGSSNLWVTGNGYSSLTYLLLDTMHVYVRPLAYNAYIAKLRLTPRPLLPGSVAGAGADPGIHVFPNPATDNVIISFAVLPEHTTIILRDIAGRILLQQPAAGKVSALNVQDFAKGLYLLEIKTPAAACVKKIMLQ